MTDTRKEPDAALEELEARLAASRAGGGRERTERQHAAGKLTAHERVDLLLDPALSSRSTPS